MSRHRSFLVLITAVVGLATEFIPQPCVVRGAEWELVWSDEFDGDAIDRTKWDYDLGNGYFDYDANVWIGGWGNDELQYYTREPENAFVKDGMLHIRAVKESFNGFGYTVVYLPDYETFRQLAADHDLVPVYRRLMSDALTPVTGLHKIDDGGSVCLFESVIGGEKVGRYSILAAGPFLELSARGSTVTIRSGGRSESFESADPLEELRRRLVNVKAAHLPGLPPFTGGAVGYAGYDVVRYTEHLPNAPADDRGLPRQAQH